jgi:hypothetical protein
MTPRVTNHLGNLDHLSSLAINPNDPKEIKISNEEIEIQTSVVLDLDASVKSFLLFYQVDFYFDPKTSIHPFDLFYNHVNPRKKMMSRSICFKGPNRVKRYQLCRTLANFRICLTLSPI